MVPHSILDWRPVSGSSPKRAMPEMAKRPLSD